ncbi:hypothetical protein FACS1894163_01370 [Spirochaetia bacterium]|nr:hypothetical protein FACS1894163_01370 [Spirochaetia bacterium]
MERESAAKYVIAHLFMFADRQISRSQLACLDNYGEALWNLSEMTEKLSSVYEKGGATQESNALKKIKECIKSLCKDVLYTSANHPSRNQLECMWIMFLLACPRDGAISKNHTVLLKLLADEWKIKKDLLMEMQDTAETKMALYSYQDWIKATFQEEDEARLTAAVDNDKEALDQSVESLITDVAGDVVDTEESSEHSMMTICNAALDAVADTVSYGTDGVTENEEV